MCIRIRRGTVSAKRYLSDKLVKDVTGSRTKKIIGFWLLGCAGMVYGAVVIGGLTRLTESGLSMVNWDLIKSMKPPLNNEQWEEEFERYKGFPEYKYKTTNEEMTLQKFKFIWTMEYVHRMWGRAVGVVFLVPCTYFWMKGHFSAAMKKRMLLATGLVISQGLVGWWMVKSGLDTSKNSNSNIPRVSQYRLCTHLTLAFILYSIYIWTGLSHLLKIQNNGAIDGISRFRGLVHGTKTAIFLTIVMGAFVAGLDAGLIYNSWPKFGDRWIPENLMSKIPKWKNFLDNEITVQFIHRNAAYLTLMTISLTWLVGRRLQLHSRARNALRLLVLAGFMQAIIGISTLVHHVPVWQASMHQNGSLILVAVVLWLAHEIRRIPK